MVEVDVVELVELVDVVVLVVVGGGVVVIQTFPDGEAPSRTTAQTTIGTGGPALEVVVELVDVVVVDVVVLPRPAAATVSFQRMVADPDLPETSSVATPFWISANQSQSLRTLTRTMLTPASNARPNVPSAIDSSRITNRPRCFVVSGVLALKATSFLKPWRLSLGVKTRSSRPRTSNCERSLPLVFLIRTTP